jgi:chemotaxis protein methyltransferase CheR
VSEKERASESLEPALRISPQSFGQLAQFITRELGIKMPESKVSLIQSRLLRRVRELGLESIDEYCDFLFSPAEAGAERIHFINAITTNKTDFFREPQHFQYLAETVLPQLEQSKRAAVDKRIAVWSAACSSGEEPYTLAMVLSEYAAGRPGFDFRILATDVSTKVLEAAKDGIYSAQQIAPVPSELRRKYLLRGKGQRGSSQPGPMLRITPALRRRVSFHQLNFIDADYHVREMFEIIFCRNVLIYFDRPTQEAVINKLCRNLIPGGYLFVSHSESLSGLNVPLISLRSSCFRKPGG